VRISENAVSGGTRSGPASLSRSQPDRLLARKRMVSATRPAASGSARWVRCAAMRSNRSASFVTPGDVVQVNGKVIEAPARTRLFRYHKPEGLMTTHKDPEGRPTVFEKLPPGLPRLISIGRLDLNSEGLLLLTNDGALARLLERPETGWLRRYRVRVNGYVDEKALAALSHGVTVEGERYGPIDAGLDSRKGDNAWLSIGLREGRNREVRRVMAHLNLQTSRLIRIAYGPFQLGLLPRGSVEEVPAKILREQLPKAATAQ